MRDAELRNLWNDSAFAFGVPPCAKIYSDGLEFTLLQPKEGNLEDDFLVHLSL